MKKQFTIQELMDNTVETGSGCREWIKARTAYGYAQKWDGEKVSYVHRIVCQIISGPVEGLDVMHLCDNPPCINPEHLRWGTRKENVADMIIKGRAKHKPSRGENHGMAKLTQTQVRELRKERASGALLRELADKYQITVAGTHHIVAGKTWKEV